MPKEYSEFLGELPDDVSGHLPDDMYSSNAEALGNAVSKMSSAEYILSYIGDQLSLGIGNAVKLLASIVGVLVISAVFSAFRFSFSSETIGKVIVFCSSCALFGCILGLHISHIERVSELLERINALMVGMIPVTGVLYAMGGNVATAVSSNSTLYLFLAFCESFCARSVVGVASVCTGLAICSSLAPSINMRGFFSAVKKGYSFVLGMIMTILLFALSSQTTLSAMADSVSARAAKLVASNVIPVVGGSVGETLRTIASSVGYLKGVCGVGAVICIVLLVIPTLVTLLLTRTVFIISVAVADLLGCDSESKVLSDIGSIYGMLIAVVCMVSVMFIFALTIFVRCTVAAG